MKLYFAYGANLNMDNMAQRCPDSVAVQPFYLEGYRLAFSSVATILLDAESKVPGALWAISDQDEAALDVFEAYPNLYHKQVISQDGLEFMVYVMNSSVPWEPAQSYLDTIQQGYRDWSLDVEDLDLAVQRTLWEIDYDMQWSTTNRTGLGHVLEEPVPVPAGHDLRWLRDARLAD